MNALESNPTAALVLAVIAGLVVGFVLATLIFRGRAGRREEVEAREAYDSYKSDVNDHFIGTAKLIDGLTDSYKALFDHLQDGAGKLLDEETLRERLAADDRVIMLSRLGSAAAITEAANDETTDAAEVEPQPSNGDGDSPESPPTSDAAEPDTPAEPAPAKDDATSSDAEASASSDSDTDPAPEPDSAPVDGEEIAAEIQTSEDSGSDTSSEAQPKS